MLILDDWGMEMLDASERSNLLEIIDTRYGKVSTVVASQLPVEKWYGMIGGHIRRSDPGPTDPQSGARGLRENR